jgi:predicted nucleotidyltransferase component of viral defense system
MKELHLLSEKERKEFFEVVASESEKTFEVIEKDFWVVWTLGHLFNLSELKNHLTFKGGTSLSKVFGIIERFSEDIDVSIEKDFLGFDENKDPSGQSTKKKQKALLEELSEACSKYIREKLIFDLSEKIKASLQTEKGWELVVDPADTQTLLFSYPSSASKESYIRPAVKIEMGARSEHWPVSEHPVQSYAKEVLKEKMSEPEVLVRVLDVERTFWEKATILHQYAHLPTEKTLPPRLSRHWYDFYKLLKSPVKQQALNKIELLERVANHKKVYFSSAWANYDLAKKGSLKLKPLSRVLADLQKDYELMEPMFFGVTPNWDEMITTISDFEAEFNTSENKK